MSPKIAARSDLFQDKAVLQPGKSSGGICSPSSDNAGASLGKQFSPNIWAKSVCLEGSGGIYVCVCVFMCTWTCICACSCEPSSQAPALSQPSAAISFTDRLSQAPELGGGFTTLGFSPVSLRDTKLRLACQANFPRAGGELPRLDGAAGSGCAAARRELPLQRPGTAAAAQPGLHPGEEPTSAKTVRFWPRNHACDGPDSRPVLR